MPHTTLQQQNVFLPSGNDHPTTTTHPLLLSVFVYVVFSLVSTCEVSGDLSSRGKCANCVLSQLRGYTFTEVYFGQQQQQQQGTKELKENKKNITIMIFSASCDLWPRLHLSGLFAALYCDSLGIHCSTFVMVVCDKH